MLFGSRSTFAPAPDPTPDPVTPPPAAPPVCAPPVPGTAVPAPLRSSTGASVVGVLEQPASAAAINPMNTYLRMPPPALWFRARRGLRHASRINNVSGPRERSPSGLAH